MLFLVIVVCIPLFFIFVMPHLIMAITNKEVVHDDKRSFSRIKFGIMIATLILSYLAIAGSILIIMTMFTNLQHTTLQIGIGSILSWISFIVIGKRWCFNLRSSNAWLIIAGLSPVITLFHPEHIEMAIFGLTALPVIILNYFIIFHQIYTKQPNIDAASNI